MVKRLVLINIYRLGGFCLRKYIWCIYVMVVYMNRFSRGIGEGWMDMKIKIMSKRIIIGLFGCL